MREFDFFATSVVEHVRAVARDAGAVVVDVYRATTGSIYVRLRTRTAQVVAIRISDHPPLRQRVPTFHVLTSARERLWRFTDFVRRHSTPKPSGPVHLVRGQCAANRDGPGTGGEP
jgi:hypothetical protein